MKFELPKLKYDYADLEPYIDAKTVEIHYSKHHQTYATNLNKALETKPEFQTWTIEDLLTKLNELPEDIRTLVQNNGGGFFNHNLYWQTMNKNSVITPVGKLGDALSKKFDGFVKFKEEFTKAGMTRFGSGWAWLVVNKGNLEITSTPNQNSPLSEGKTPILGLDVWEHAYYLKYQNRRNEYIENWWNVVDWKEVEKIYNQI